MLTYVDYPSISLSFPFCISKINYNRIDSYFCSIIFAKLTFVERAILWKVLTNGL